jgi:mannose-6-phosphate isomerase-like protein (cupin superfamily)/DNA-binding XRE family transcriptional regulator
MRDASTKAKEWERFAISIKQHREEQKLTIRELSQRTRELENADGGIQAAQISRIENGKIVPDLREVLLLLKALSLSTEDVFGRTSLLPPWYVVRGEDATTRLEEIKQLWARDRTTVKVTRANTAHQEMVDAGVFRYVPLDANAARHNNRSGDLRRLMQAYYFEVNYASDEVMRKQMATHEGEEILYVLDGSIELWHGAAAHGPFEQLRLGPGDLAHFRSSVYHNLRQGGPTPARALFIYSHHTAQFDTPPAVTLSYDGDKRGDSQ